MLAICKIYFPWNQNFDKSAKLIAHEIFALYGKHKLSIQQKYKCSYSHQSFNNYAE